MSMQTPTNFNKANLDRIWKDLYLVRVPMQYLYSEDDVRHRGLPSTGDHELDRKRMEAPELTYRTINDIFELWRQGVAVAVVNYDDTKRIYEAIQNHLQVWLSFMTYGVHIHATPFDDLLDLDQFANVVYDNAKYVFDPTAIRNINTSWNGLGIDLSPGAFFAKKGGGRFFHLLKSQSEKDTEASVHQRDLLTREGYSEELIRMADRYDHRPREEMQKSLRFANDKKWN